MQASSPRPHRPQHRASRARRQRVRLDGGSKRPRSTVLDRFADAGLNAIDTADAYSAWAPGNSGAASRRRSSASG